MAAFGELARNLYFEARQWTWEVLARLISTTLLVLIGLLNRRFRHHAFLKSANFNRCIIKQD
ncbi:MAG: hypothetical protein AAF570_23185, partial [Bacteroidota bacterium]